MTDKLKPLTAPEFVSCSANAEDVLLRRLFPGPEPGFYVDVGAGHPVWENDTKALCDRGWRGINVEPQEDFLAELRRARPGDVNLGVALSDAPGERTFFEVENTGLSTLDPHNAARAEAAGRRVKPRTVPVRTLTQVLVENNAPSRFEFLKVDVEGLEQAVLAGNDWQRFRPHVVMIEATLPETPIRRQDDCRALLGGVGWRHVWFDGLNDWYLAPDFVPPNGAFDAPPNIFDRYVTSRTVEAEAAVRALEVDNARLCGCLADVNTELAKHHLGLSQALAQTQSDEARSFEVHNARLRVRLADVTADLAKHKKALSQVQNDLVSTRLEVADARAESQLFREAMAQVQAQSAAEAADARAQINHLRAVITQAQAQAAALHQEIKGLHASVSWRVSAPVRLVGRMLRALRVLPPT